MITRIKKIRRNVLVVIALCLMCVFLFPSAIAEKAFAEGKTVYSDVLEDLQKDESFNPESYPAKDSGEYSVSVIQIAESTKSELFVYTYEPRRGTKELNATSINISTAINDSLKYANYKLELLSASGVFGKYLVKDFAVLADALRYYDISTVYRAWDNDIDGAITGGDGSEKAYTVGCVYSASTVGDTVSYVRRETEIIEIRVEDRFDGSIRYYNGFNLVSYNACDSWFVAFKSDRKIDDLMEADIYWLEAPHFYSYVVGGGVKDYDTEDPEEKYLTLFAEDEVGNKADGWFADKRVWKRIERASDFAAKEDLSPEAKKKLEDKQWVLRFAETEFRQYDSLGSQTIYSTRVSDVTILRLMFETDGVVYNLGVVSDKVIPDTTPDGGTEYEKPQGCTSFNLGDLWKYILLGIAVIAALVIVIAFFPHIINLVIWLIKLLVKLAFAVIKGLWLIISAPFRGIAALVRKRKR